MIRKHKKNNNNLTADSSILEGKLTRANVKSVSHPQKISLQ